MSHIARCSTKLVNVKQDIMDEALRLVAERNQAATGVKVQGATNARWTIGVPPRTSENVEHQYFWRSQPAHIAFVTAADGMLQVIHDQDYTDTTRRIQAEVVQEYMALALRIALARLGYRVEQEQVEGARVVMGAMA
jgi:hypothetical protein